MSKLKSFEELRVIEIAEGVAGPCCGLLLADLGAEVIKVEPRDGDRSREWGLPTESGDAAIFEHLNRGKRSIVLDPGENEGRNRLESLLATADVLVVHADPAEADAIGIDWKAAGDRHPRLVVCEINDMGETGRFAGLPGSELTLQAMSGFTRYIGDRGGEPCRVGFEIVGQATAMHAFQGIAAALYHRQASGRGQYLSVSGLGAILSMKTILFAAQSGDTDDWTGFHLNGPRWPADTGWDTKDGQVTFDFRHNQRDAWVKLCEALGLGHLPDDPEYEDWRSTIYLGDRRFTHGHPYREKFAVMTSAEVSALINSLGGISVKFHDYGEVLSHPQVQLLDLLVDAADAPAEARTQLGLPFRFAGEERSKTFGRAPRLDEHGAAILAELAGGTGRPVAKHVQN